jgi:hypothetical protein
MFYIRSVPSRFAALPYDEALAQAVLDRIAAGEMLRDLWRDPALPTRGDLRRWRHADPTFAARVRAAVNAARSRRMLTLDEATAERIYRRLCNGASLRAICADRSMPGVATVFDWLRRDPEFRRTYALGRRLQSDLLAERAWEIAQSIPPFASRSAASVLDRQIRHIFWHAAKVAPKKWGGDR